MKFPRPIITREHGSWAVLLVPMAIAAGTVGVFNTDALFLVLAALGAFMSYVPIHSILREILRGNHNAEQIRPAAFWGTVYSGIGSLAAVRLLVEGYWLLLGLAAAGVVFFAGNFFLTRRLQKTVLTDFVAVAGLTLGSPAMYYVLTGSLDQNALILYVLTLLFFGSNVVYVHMKIRVTRSKKSDWNLSESLAVGKLNLGYHIFVIGVILALSFYRLTPATAIMAFVPIAVHAIYGTYRLSSRVSFSRLGFALLAQSILFSLLWIMISRT